MGARATAEKCVPGCAFCRAVSRRCSSGVAAWAAAASSVAASASLRRQADSVVAIVGGLQVAGVGRGEAAGSLHGRAHRHLDAHALGDHHVNLPAGIDLDDREGVLGELDVVLGEPVEGLADAVPEACAVGVGGRGGGGHGAERRGAGLGGGGCQALADTAHHAGEQCIGEHLALLGDEGPGATELALGGHLAILLRITSDWPKYAPDALILPWPAIAATA